MKKQRFFLLVLLAACLLSPLPATEEYSNQTKKSCSYCHRESSGGGELTQAGEEYLGKLLDESETEGSGKPPTGHRGFLHYFRLLVGFIHIFTGIFWFGTILYVHIILKPAYAAHGLPKGEVRLGLVSMVVMGISGTILTLFRVPSFSFFLDTRFGVLLLIKILIFLVMVLTALYVVIMIGPKLKRARGPEPLKSLRSDAGQGLDRFDGREGRPAYIVYKEQTYDVTSSEHWTDGLHFGRHKAGEDLTKMLKQAPHGEEKLLAVPGIKLPGAHWAGRNVTPQVRVFFVLAYLNLGFVILITMILALWKWL